MLDSLSAELLASAEAPFQLGRNAPPRRHDLDSSDDQDSEDYGRAEASRTAFSSKIREPAVLVDFPKQSPGALDLIVAIEEAGRSWAEGFDDKELREAGHVTVNDKKVDPASRGEVIETYCLRVYRSQA